MNIQELNDDLSKITKRVLFSQPFYGLLLLSIDKKWEDVGTACVGYKDLSFYLKIDPKFWKKLSDDHKSGLLIHELDHIAYFHLTDFKRIDKKDKMISNIAKDIEINQRIDKKLLPKGALLNDNLKDIPPMEAFMGTHYYFDELYKENQKSNDVLDELKKLFSDSGNEIELDNGEVLRGTNHNWEIGDVSEVEKKLIETQLTQLMNEVVEQTKKMHGNVPGGIEEILKLKNKIEPVKVNWREVVRTFVGKSHRRYIKPTRRKPNLRIDEFQGLKHLHHKKLFVGIDTSASVSSRDLQDFYNELLHMRRMGIEIDVAHCDTSFKFIGKFKRNQEVEIHGRGGTSFQPVIDYYNEHHKKYNALIYLTDGEAPAPTKPKGKMLWVITRNGDYEKNLPGSIIQMN